MYMHLRGRLLKGTALVAFSGMVYAQQNPAPEGAQQGFQRRLNTVVQRGDGGTNQNTQNAEGYDPLSFYRRNPELMKRYFPHLVQAENTPGGAGSVAQASNPRTSDKVVLDAFRFNGGTAAEFVQLL